MEDEEAGSMRSRRREAKRSYLTCEEDRRASRAPRVAETTMSSAFRARIFARGGGEICQVPKFDKLDAKLLKAVFS